MKHFTALYAFCREVDDIADECLDHEIASKKLNWWRDEIERLFKDEPQHPVSKALHPLHRDTLIFQRIILLR